MSTIDLSTDPTPALPRGVADPSDLHRAWAARFNAGDLDGMLALAEDTQAFAPAPGVVTTGDDARTALGGFLAMGLPISMQLRRSVVAGDLALLVADWRLQGTTATGDEVDLRGSTADVARRTEHGWRFAIDNPFGTA